MIYKKYNNGSYVLHLIKTDRFKNIRMDIIFRNNIEKEQVVKRTVLFDMLLENNKEYKTKRDLILRQEELYNMNLYSVNIKLGAQNLSYISCDFLNPKFTKDDYLENALKLPFDLIFNPNIENNEFDENTLLSVKERLKADIKTVLENPTKVSIKNALNSMDKYSLSSVNLIGNEELLELVNTSNLYEEYEYVLKHDYIDIYIIGDYDENKIIDIIDKYSKFNTIKNHKLDLYVDNKCRKIINRKMEKSEFNQTQIVYILNLNDLKLEEKKYASQVYNMILGGGSLDTKLYQNLREKNSLCYNVSSIYYKFDNLLLIKTAVDKKNIKIACKLIESTINEMKTNISEDELNNAVSSILTGLYLSYDQPDRIIDNYLFNDYYDLDSLEERIEKYQSLKIDDIKKIAKKVKINTIYILEGGDNVNGN